MYLYNTRMTIYAKTFLAAAALAVLAISPSEAVTTTFAQFQQDGTGSPFTFSSASGLLDVTGSIPVAFTFQTSNGTGIVGSPIDAMLTFSGVTSGAPVTFGGQVFQGFQTVAFTFTADTPIAGQTQLLQVNYPTAILNGSTGGNTANLSGSSLDSAQTFSSDFLTFSPADGTNFQLPLSNLSPTLGVSSNTLNSFTSGGSGTFAGGVVAVPEAGASELILIGLTLVVLPWAIRRARVGAY